VAGGADDLIDLRLGKLDADGLARGALASPPLAPRPCRSQNPTSAGISHLVREIMLARSRPRQARLNIQS